MRITHSQRAGKSLKTWWTDIAIAARFSTQYKGYPTQKPLKLLDRIIRASTNAGDVVLDPFAGCATACVAAEKLGRQWAGIDIEPKARELVVERLQDETDLKGLFKGGRLVLLNHLKTPPKRTDADAPRRSKNIKDVLYERQAGRCAGPCGPDEKGRQLDIDLFEGGPYRATLEKRHRHGREPATAVLNVQSSQGLAHDGAIRRSDRRNLNAGTATNRGMRGGSEKRGPPGPQPDFLVENRAKPGSDPEAY